MTDSDRTDSDRRARPVLDTSAVTAFAPATGSVAVGELLAEIDTEFGAALIPYACLVEAASQLPDAGLGEDLTLPFED